MKKFLITLLLALSTAVGAQPAQPEQFFATGTMLLEALRGGDPNAYGAAALYLAGAFDATWQAMHCAGKPEVPNMLAAVKGELERIEKDAPDALQMPAARFLVMPLLYNFPCKKSPTT